MEAEPVEDPPLLSSPVSSKSTDSAGVAPDLDEFSNEVEEIVFNGEKWSREGFLCPFVSFTHSDSRNATRGEKEQIESLHTLPVVAQRESFYSTCVVPTTAWSFEKTKQARHNAAAEKLCTSECPPSGSPQGLSSDQHATVLHVEPEAAERDVIGGRHRRTGSAQSSVTNCSPFKFSQSALQNVVRSYVTRDQFQDVHLILNYGGVSAFEEGLLTSFQNGLDLTGAEAERNTNALLSLHDRRIALFGSNTLPQRRPTSFCRLCLDAASDFTLRVLMLCGIVSIVLGVTLGDDPKIEWIEGFAIWVAVVVVILITTTNDWVKEKQFRKLAEVKGGEASGCAGMRSRSDDKVCRLIRSGKEQEAAVSSLVVGDVIHVEAGDEVPADCLLISGTGVAADESSLSGESESVQKATVDECWSHIQKHHSSLQHGKQHSFNEQEEDPERQPHHLKPYDQGMGAEQFAPGPSVDLRQRTPHRILAGLKKLSENHPGEKLEKRQAPLNAPHLCDQSTAHAQRRPSDGIREKSDEESDMKGEAQQKESQVVLMEKGNIPSPILLAGTTLVAGSGRAVVLCVGIYSQQGEIHQQLTAFDAEPTPLQNKLNALARDIGRAGLFAACLTLVALIIQFWVLYALTEQGRRPAAVSIGRDHVDFLITAITILVVAVPEGLPLAVTISLAYSISRMLKDQNYVRRLAACETMGGANDICSDKTGTLTKNTMSVEAVWNGQNIIYRNDPMWKKWKVLAGHLHKKYVGLGTAQGARANDSKGHLEQGKQCDTWVYPNKYFEVLMDNICLNSTGVLEQQVVPQMSSPMLSRLISMASNTAAVVRHTVKQVGSPTECALLQFACDFGFDYQRIRDEKLLEDTDLIYREPFSSDRKIMTTVVNAWQQHAANLETSATVSGEHGNLQDSAVTQRVFVKGAAETVLNLCTDYVKPVPFNTNNKEGDESSTEAGGGMQCTDGCVSSHSATCPLTEEAIHEIENTVIKKMAGEALRTICLAYKDITTHHEDMSWMQDSVRKPYKEMETGLTCLAIVGIRDPVRDEVPEAVRACQKAGIKVRMVTGDNLDTAKQIALQCNIFHPKENGLAMTGAEFNALVGGVVCCHCKVAHCDCPRNQTEERKTGRKMRTDVLARPEAFDKIADNLEVLARSQPMDKYVLVVGLKQRRNAVVAVTGDGANDAPALKTADVGFAMGVSGKEVAKRAADIVLLDDNFGSIVKAVLWGRNIYDNIRRFLQFQLTVNVVAVVTALLTVMVLRESPLTAVQMLWVNLIMDSLASLALATEPPTDDLLKRGPHSREEYLISRIMFRNIVGQAVYQLAVMLLLIFAGDCFIPEMPWTFLSPEKRQKFPDFCEFADCHRGNMPPTGSLIRSGRRYHPFSTAEDYQHKWHVELGASRHYTLVFNVFVFMQICNMLNARKINNEWNIFRGLLKNKMWMFVATLIGCVQALVVQFGNRAMSCHPQGLSGLQWILTLAFGAGSIAVSYLLRILPYKWLPEAGRKEVHLLEESRTLALASRGRRSSERVSLRLGGGVGLTSEQREAIVRQISQSSKNMKHATSPPSSPSITAARGLLSRRARGSNSSAAATVRGI